MAQVTDPFSFKGSSTGVLMLHGFTGSPASLKPWAQYLAEQNYSVELPVLPGHATSWQELNRTSWHQWYAAAQLAYLKLAKDCTNVFVAGISMGGALALRLAQHQPAINGLMLVNPALQAKSKLLRFAPLLGKIVPSVPAIGNSIAKPDMNEFAYDRTPVAAAGSMLDLWSDVKKGLHLITAPTMVFTSLNDQIVPPASSDLILRSISTPPIHREQVLLERSLHVATLDYEMELIFEKSMNFVAEKSQLR
jgi:carboxylesterase